MFKPKTFIELCNCLQSRAEVEINGIKGVVNAIEAEDGSGRNFNITMSVFDLHLRRNTNQKTFFREG
jgi:hypothetical protein